MKKLSFLIVFATISLLSTAFAQKDIVSENQPKTVEIKLTDLPQAVITFVTSNFTEHTPAQAFKTLNEEKQLYIVEYTKEDVIIKVLFDAAGNVIEQLDNVL